MQPSADTARAEHRPLAEYFEGIERDRSDTSSFTASQVAEIIRKDRDAGD